MVRDISILVNDALSAETVRGTIRSAAPDTLIQVREFDRYQGKGIPDGKVSLSFRLTFQSPGRTLTDDECSAAMTAIVTALTQRSTARRARIGTWHKTTQSQDRRPRIDRPARRKNQAARQHHRANQG